ncbi:type I polyketide synthase [Nostoc sp. UCD121]|uniref:PfaB family protein n=1 Tax=unclassified Nostoc TaxID=2593658 RepID=UPI001629A845|nr:MULTISPECIES: type I polyketide synthase [unclassified Nostoc]MBC1219230.1 type I polyketide synthase [Nostoc sp. UCD120]MBC1274629.1 type I polyketide synthase [Nostoc sp. UCD121]MBC1295490.1 type I polyketide synthase [Nostoc sp. UCD122]
MEGFSQNKIPKIAIVGMDCYLGGGCKGLDAFERSIYEGIQHFISIPPQRWQAIEAQQKLLKNYGFADGVLPLGAYIKDFEIDTFRLEISPEEVDNFNPQELLMLQVADNALKDAALHQGTRIAIIIATAKELTLHQQKEQLEVIDKYNEYPSYIENSVANYISKLWNFAGPTFTLIAEENSVFKALELAQKLLAIREVDAVLVGAIELAGDGASVLQRNQITKVNTGVNTLSYDQNANGWIVGEGAAAVVLKLHDTAKRENNRIYATIDALSLVENSKSKINSSSVPNTEVITQACQQAFHLADIQPTDINYLEVVGSGIPQQDELEIQGLLTAYRTFEANLTCAIGSVKANIGHTSAASGIVSLVKTALCLYHRYIPAVPQWSGPKMPEIWRDSPFYVASESKPWFLEKGAAKRIAAINGMEIDGSYAHLILSEELSQKHRSSRYLEQMPYYVFAIAADDQSTLLDQIRTLQQTIQNCSSLSAAAKLTFKAFQQHQQATYAVAILGHNQDELQREIKHSLRGIVNAFETGKDWQSPLGSYFTAKPLGQRSKIAFVYPGAFSAYIGLGQNLFRLFPQLYDEPLVKSSYNRIENVEKLVYPRSLKKLSNRQLEDLEQKLISDPIAILESEMFFARVLTAILNNYFQIKSQGALGYSLGEISMILAQGIWDNFQDGSQSFNSSPLFKTRLSGSKNAVREYWGLPQEQDDKGKDFWGNYILMCPVSRVKEAIKHENRVYLLLINTSEEVVIAGEVQACKRVIANLNCNAFSAPFTHVIHCEAMRSEYDEIVRLNTLPIQNVSETIFYSTAEYKPINLDSHSIAHNIAQNICKQLNFPQLINRVYEDGFKIFIEVGAGSNCSRWIDKILNQKEYVTVSLNKRGVDDHTSIVKSLAKLLSHRVDLDLSPLYSQESEILNQSQSRVKTINLGNSKISYTSLKKRNQEILQDISIGTVNQQQYQLLELKEFAHMNSSLLQNPTKSLENTSTNLETLPEQASFENSNKSAKVLLQERHETVEKSQINKSWATEQETPSLTTYGVTDEPHLLNLRSPYYQDLSENASRMTKAHAIFLQARQESLKQISAIIQLQMACYQKLFES